MKSYNKLEYKISNMLGKNPAVKNAVKNTYQFINYFFHRRNSYSYKLHKECRIMSPEEWSGTDVVAGELFFGYYDKSPWFYDMSVCFFNHINGNNLDLIVFDKEKRKMKTLYESVAWNYQQGCMAQWLPGSEKRILFNDVENKTLGARLISVEGNLINNYSMPVQAINPDGREFIALNYLRLFRLRKEYGYRVNADNFLHLQPIDEDGLWLVDMETGDSNLIISLQDLAELNYMPEMERAEHKVNHVIYSPGGGKFAFLHRFFSGGMKYSRLYVANRDGSNLKLLLDEGMISHFCWRDEDTIIVWGRTKKYGDRYYMLNYPDGKKEIMGQGIVDVYGDGHPSYSPDRRFLITDTYPDRSRHSGLLLYNVRDNTLVELGSFFNPLKFRGTVRCDLHPRWSPDGNYISIDSVHEGKRRTYIIEVSSLLK